MKFVRQTLSSVDRFFESRSHNAVLIICLAAALLIGALDFRGSPGVLILYLVPVAVASWYGGKSAGWVISTYCAIAWLIQSIYSQPNGLSMGNQFIDLGARLITFCFLVMIIGQLRATMALQKELTGFIIHDLRSPISSSITGLLTLQQSQDELNDLSREMVDLALVSNQRALHLVNSMLDVAKFESGGMQISHDNVDLLVMCRTCIEQVELWARGAEVKIETRLQSSEGILDRELTSRVIVNLLSNAIKFSPPASTITIAAERRDGVLRMSVSDQGPGIPPEYASTIFEPFAQVKGTKGGTGLGLTFCRLAVQAQAGKIWVETQLGHGTSIVFTLPKA